MRLPGTTPAPGTGTHTALTHHGATDADRVDPAPAVRAGEEPAARPGATAVGPAGDLPAQLQVSGVNKTYQARRGEVHALSDVNLTIGRGEFISLVGRSGCGKTTLLRILAGLLPPTSGVVEADGESIWRNGKRNDEAFKQFGLVFQDANLFPWYTVAENVSLPLKLRGMGKKAR
ncbi:ATP-binding cassette domain-containing protein, partial [Modestobacter versicolor]